MTYAELTRFDPNPIKRWLHRRRLEDALRLSRLDDPEGLIVDYGGGDGELALMLAARHERARIVCFEPWAPMREQAARATAGEPRISIAAEEADLAEGTADLVVCAEVFEHLPPSETEAALDRIEAVLKPGGRLLAGAPVELGPPALIKGLFRMARRADAFDGRLRNVVSAALYRPPGPRPVTEIAPGRPYYLPHTGFDHRTLRRRLRERFAPELECGSPLGAAPSWASSELYMRVRKRT